MLHDLRQSVGLLYARWYFRKDSQPQQPLTDFFRRSRSILVVLPQGDEEAAIAGTTLRKLWDVLKNMHLTIVSTGIRPTLLSDSFQSEVILLEDVDVNKFFIPRKSVLQRVLARPYDVALDLNLDFILHAAYICKASHAPVRVAAVRQYGETFFNVQLNLDHTAPPQIVYEKFVQCLAMF